MLIQSLSPCVQALLWSGESDVAVCSPRPDWIATNSSNSGYSIGGGGGNEGAAATVTVEQVDGRAVIKACGLDKLWATAVNFGKAVVGTVKAVVKAVTKGVKKVASWIGNTVAKAGSLIMGLLGRRLSGSNESRWLGNTSNLTQLRLSVIEDHIERLSKWLLVLNDTEASAAPQTPQPRCACACHTPLLSGQARIFSNNTATALGNDSLPTLPNELDLSAYRSALAAKPSMTAVTPKC